MRSYAAMTPNGRLVHVYRGGDRFACGQPAYGTPMRVFARVSCSRCAARAPRIARRWRDRPLAVGLDWEPYYEHLANVLAGNPTETVVRELEEADRTLRKRRIYFPIRTAHNGT